MNNRSAPVRERGVRDSESGNARQRRGAGELQTEAVVVGDGERLSTD